MRSLFSNKYLWTLTLGHFTIDLYSGAMPFVLLYLTTSLGLTLGQVGLVAALYSLCSSLSQPIFGYLADRYGGRGLAAGGLVWISIFQGLSGFVPDFNTLLIIAPLAGFGSAAFHPSSASSANRTSGEKKSAGMAIFLLGGNSGYAVGPVVADMVLGGFALGGFALIQGMGVHGTAAISLVGLIIAPILWVLATRHQPTRAVRVAQKAGARRLELNPAFSKTAVIALVLVMSLRAWVQSSVSLYVPQFFTSIGGMTFAEASRLSFLILGSLAIGSLFGGFLGERIGGRTVMALSFLIAGPASVALFAFPDLNIYVSAVVLGFVTGSSWPLTLVMAQELMPKNAGIASGIALGFVFAMGGVGNAVTGFMAERIGLLNSMLIVSAMPVFAALCTLALPSHRDIASGATLARASMEPAVVKAEG